MITVGQADIIIGAQVRNYGVEKVPYELALGRVLAEDLFADRDLPPFNRSTVDGIAIDFEAYKHGNHAFKIKGIQGAGEPPIAIESKDECIEIMTGGVLDKTVNAVIRYEDFDITGGMAMIKGVKVKEGQNVHLKGSDMIQGAVVADADRKITPALIGLAASIGKVELPVRKLPRIIVISTGNEMVTPDATPTPYQLRRSNGAMIKSVLGTYRIKADLVHLADNFELLTSELKHYLVEYDIVLMTGGVSMGKFDYVPKALEGLGVMKLFHKIKQRPGKPLWFGVYGGGALVFGFPGNPVSVFMCLHRYFIPWLEASLGLKPRLPEYAALQNDLRFPYPLQYFAQVKLQVDGLGRLEGRTADTNGSGDFSNLLYTDAFMELPLEKAEFKKGEMYKIWRYRF